MNVGTAKWIFIIGTASSAAILLAATVDMHRQVDTLTNADKLSEQVVDGKRVFEKYNCNDCHTILGFGAYYAPDLTRVHARLGKRGIVERVRKPEVAFAKSFRHMPSQHLSEKELEDLAAFFQWINAVQNNEWPPQDAARAGLKKPDRAGALSMGMGMSRGAALFKEKGCMKCHALGGVGGDDGPALDGIGARWTPAKIRDYTRDPASQDPAAGMPAHKDLADVDLAAITDFLSQQR